MALMHIKITLALSVTFVQDIPPILVRKRPMHLTDSQDAIQRKACVSARLRQVGEN